MPFLLYLVLFGLPACALLWVMKVYLTKRMKRWHMPPKHTLAFILAILLLPLCPSLFLLIIFLLQDEKLSLYAYFILPSPFYVVYSLGGGLLAFRLHRAYLRQRRDA